MLPKKNRLTTRQFERSFRRSKRVHAGPYTFLVSEGKDLLRCAVVVGKKVSKSAVKRNRIRRQLYALLEKSILPKNPLKNVICLYQGTDTFSEHEAFTKACDKLLPQLT